jgi:general secretion pathway protein G
MYSFSLCRFPGRARTGFTLLELLVVIGIIAVLTGLVIGVGRAASASGRNARARAELAALSVALDAYKLTYGDYPRTDQTAHLLQSLIGKRGPAYQPVTGRALIESAKFATAGALDPFTTESAELLDPWEHPYRYAYHSQTPWTNPSYVLYSVGPDGSDTATLLTGGFPDTAATGNADNLNANQ